MPAVLALPWLGTAIAGGAAATGAIVAANKTSNATTTAAADTTAAANHAADVQAESAKEALAFQEAQAQNEAANAEVNRKANYDLMAAKQAKLGSIGELLGLGGVTTPAYVPGITPNFTAGQPTTGAAVVAGGPTAPTPVQARPVTSPVAAQTATAAPVAADAMGGLVLQPDGTYKFAGALPKYGSVGSYLP